MANPDRSPYAPDFSKEELFVEKTWFQGALLSSVGYGAVAVVSFMCIYLLVQDKRPTNRTKWYLMAYVLVMFSISTVFQAANSEFSQQAFIDYRAYPGGPSAYENDFWNIPVNNAGNVIFVLSNWFADGVLLWRFSIIYRQAGPLAPIILFPGLMYMGSLALGSLFIAQMSTHNPFETSGISWTLPYLALALSLNIILTLAIVIRLIYFRWSISKALGPSHGTQYTSVASIIIESAALHACMSLAFLISDGLGSPLATTFLQGLMPDQVLASLLIIFRVARGQAWSSQTSTQVFKSGPTSTSGRSGSIPLSDMQFRAGKQDSNVSRTQDGGDPDILVVKSETLV